MASSAVYCEIMKGVFMTKDICWFLLEPYIFKRVRPGFRTDSMFIMHAQYIPSLFSKCWQCNNMILTPTVPYEITRYKQAQPNIPSSHNHFNAFCILHSSSSSSFFCTWTTVTMTTTPKCKETEKKRERKIKGRDRTRKIAKNRDRQTAR